VYCTNVDVKISPLLHAKQEELKKKKLEDSLNSKLEHRTPRSELVGHNILRGTLRNRFETNSLAFLIGT
jgi:hypothetical protein